VTSAPDPQPGGRPPAPGELALVQAFINSHFDLGVDHGADLFATPRALAEWLRRRELLAPREPVSRADARRAVAVREALRSLASANADAGSNPSDAALAALDDAGRGATVEIRFSGGAPRFVPGAACGLDRAIGRVLGIAARAMIDGSWSRLKVCPGEDCGWAFYDHSRNQSGRWCSMSVCGGRVKARAHYRRTRGGRD
jgi:predicted RNA-binding Zn ribbon-like protein